MPAVIDTLNAEDVSDMDKPRKDYKPLYFGRFIDPSQNQIIQPFAVGELVIIPPGSKLSISSFVNFFGLAAKTTPHLQEVEVVCLDDFVHDAEKMRSGTARDSDLAPYIGFENENGKIIFILVTEELCEANDKAFTRKYDVLP